MNKKEREILLKMIDIYKLKIKLLQESIVVAEKKLGKELKSRDYK